MPINRRAWFDALFRCKRCGAEFVVPHKHGKLTDAEKMQDKLTQHVRREHPEPEHIYIKEADTDAE